MHHNWLLQNHVLELRLVPAEWLHQEVLTGLGLRVNCLLVREHQGGSPKLSCIYEILCICSRNRNTLFHCPNKKDKLGSRMNIHHHYVVPFLTA